MLAAFKTTQQEAAARPSTAVSMHYNLCQENKLEKGKLNNSFLFDFHPKVALPWQLGGLGWPSALATLNLRTFLVHGSHPKVESHPESGNALCLLMCKVRGMACALLSFRIA